MRGQPPSKNKDIVPIKCLVAGRILSGLSAIGVASVTLQLMLIGALSDMFGAPGSWLSSAFIAAQRGQHFGAMAGSTAAAELDRCSASHESDQ